MEINIKLQRLHAKQKEVVNSKAKIRVVCAGRQSGKSFVAREICIQALLAGKRVGYLTPEFSLSKKFHRMFLDILPSEFVLGKNKSDLIIDTVTQGNIQFYSSNAIDNVRGNTFDLWIIDEAAYQDDLDYNINEVIIPTMNTTEVDIVVISTPNGFDYFYSMYSKGLNKEVGYESFNYNLYDNPVTNKEQIEFLKSNVTEAVWNQEYLAIPSEGTSPFGSKYNKNVISELSKKPPVVIGLDIAFSVDYTVAIGLDEDGVMCLFERMKGEPVIVIEKLKQLPINIPIYIDSTGAGKVVYSQMALSHNIYPYLYTGQSKQKLMFNLVMGVDAESVKYLDIVSKEMSTMGSNMTSSGITQFYNKPGYFDDCVQALALAYLHLPLYKVNWSGFYQPKK